MSPVDMSLVKSTPRSKQKHHRSGTKRARLQSRLTQTMRVRGYMMVCEVAEKIGIHHITVYRWIHDGKIRAKDFSGAYYVDWLSVMDYLGDVAEILGLHPDEPTRDIEAGNVEG